MKHPSYTPGPATGGKTWNSGASALVSVGVIPPALNVFPTTATAGTPGTFSNPGDPSATIDVPDDLAEINSLGALGNTAAWATDEHVLLEGGTSAYWDGSAWVAGRAPATTTPTGVTAGAPGSFTPAGSTAPADLAALQALGALGQTTAWTPGQCVDLTDSSRAHWDGSAWQAGEAP